MEKDVITSLQSVVDDWKWMQYTEGEEGAQWAEKLEKDFYHFIDVFEGWFHSLDKMPTDQASAEVLPLVIRVQDMLPGPLQLNFLTELERIVEGVTSEWYD